MHATTKSIKPAYHLSEAADSADAFDEDFTFTTCDLGRYLHGNTADKAAFADELGSAMQDIGFVILEGHGVDPALIQNAEDTIEEVFTSVTLEDKMRFPRRTPRRGQRGVFPRQGDQRHPSLTWSKAGFSGGGRLTSITTRCRVRRCELLGRAHTWNRPTGRSLKPSSHSSSQSCRASCNHSGATPTCSTRSSSVRTWACD